MTVQECSEEWLKVYVHPQLAVNTIRGYEVNLSRHILPYIGNVKIQQLSPATIQEMYEKLAEKGLGPRSIRYVHTTLHEVLGDLCSKRLVYPIFG